MSDESYEWPEFYQPRLVKGISGTTLTSYCLALEAWRRGLEVKITHPQLWVIHVTDGANTVTFNGSKPMRLTSKEASQTIIHKQATTDALRAAGVAAPQTILFHAEEEPIEDVLVAAEDLGYPVVLKPLSGSKGEGVLVGISDAEELRASYDWLLNTFGAQDFILEKHFDGEEYRVYVVGGRCVAAGLKIPAHVIGDGEHTVQELIEIKNKDRLKNPFLGHALIKPDFEVDALVEKQGYSYDSILEAGEYLRLRGKASGSQGGDFRDCTETLPPHIRDAAVRSVAAIPGLAAAGVDILHDSSKPEGEDYTVIELNNRAHIALNMYPTEGTGQDVPKAIIDAFFPESERLETRGLKNLGFNIPDTLAPLRNGSAEAVIVAKIPRRGFPVRRRFTMNGLDELSPSQRKRIIKASREHKVAGHVNLSTSTLVAGGVSSSLEAFRAEVASITGAVIGEGEIWRQPLQIGFRFREK
ncbi:ATP-grasp domain-containing protein [Leucobacter tenebrionis]|uniref:ATP-grasp domain-containing protein n=1 Tax=Leucobacter tenebrionis TaxID=2873270 RepID=UPI001CA6AF81|nr:ATP-grasp domain-containing protein [Leucobacter tenebrionis]QZY53130.1 ATP-grasp domain-containing protein [Leucobacter tenebrionis]